MFNILSVVLRFELSTKFIMPRPVGGHKELMGRRLFDCPSVRLSVSCQTLSREWKGPGS